MKYFCVCGRKISAANFANGYMCGDPACQEHIRWPDTDTDTDTDDATEEK